MNQDKVIECLLRWNIGIIALICCIHYMSHYAHYDVVELPLLGFFFIGKLLSIPQVWVTLLVVWSVRHLKS